MLYNFILLNSYRAKKIIFCSPLSNIENFIQETLQKFHGIRCHLKCSQEKLFWNIRKISAHRVQNPMKKIEIDEYFQSYYSVKGERFFLNMEYLH